MVSCQLMADSPPQTFLGVGTNCTLPIRINRLMLFHILRFAFCEMKKIVYLCEK